MTDIKNKLSPYFAEVVRGKTHATGVVVGTYHAEPIVLVYMPSNGNEELSLKLENEKLFTQRAIKICSDSEDRFHLLMRKFPIVADEANSGLVWFGSALLSNNSFETKGVIIHKKGKVKSKIVKIETDEVENVRIFEEKKPVMIEHRSINKVQSPLFDEFGLLIGFLKSELTIEVLEEDILDRFERRLRAFLDEFEQLIIELKKGLFFKHNEDVFLDIFKHVLESKPTNDLSVEQQGIIEDFEKTLDTYESEFFNVIHKSMPQLHKDSIWLTIVQDIKESEKTDSVNQIVTVILITWASIEYAKTKAANKINTGKFDNVLEKMSKISNYQIHFKKTLPETIKVEVTTLLPLEEAIEMPSEREKLKREVGHDVWQLIQNLMDGKKSGGKDYGDLFKYHRNNEIAKALRSFPDPTRDHHVVNSVAEDLNFNLLCIAISLAEFWLTDLGEKKNNKIKLGNYL